MPSSQISLVKATVLELPGFNTKFGPNPAQLYSYEYLHLLWRNLCLSRHRCCQSLYTVIDLGKGCEWGRERGECTISTHLDTVSQTYYVSKIPLLEAVLVRGGITNWSFCQGIEEGWRHILSPLHKPGSSGQYCRLARGARTRQLPTGERRLLCPPATLTSCSVLLRAKVRKTHCQ